MRSQFAQANNSNIPLIIIILVVAGVGSAVLYDAFVAKPLGDLQIRPTIQRTVSSTICNASRFESEYGTYSEDYPNSVFAYENQAHFLLSFDNNWETIVENINEECYFVEDPIASKNLFVVSSFKNAILSLDKNFYSPFIMCNRSEKGSETLCTITTEFKELQDSISITLLADVPESAFNILEKRFKGDDWAAVKMTSVLGKNAVKFSKIIKGTQIINITVELTSIYSCNLLDTRLLRVFNLANDINQTYTDAKNSIFGTGSIIQLQKTNQEIDILYLLNNENPDSYKDLIKTLSNLITSETYCNEFKPRKNIIEFNEAIKEVQNEAEQKNNNFQSELQILISGASQEIELEKSAKEENKPLGWNLLKFGKFLEFLTYNSGSSAAFAAQKYNSAKNNATKGITFYQNIWKNSMLWGFDYFLAFLIPVIILISLAVAHYGLKII